MMMRTLLGFFAVLFLVTACGFEERSVTLSEAKAIADRRYIAHAKAWGVPESPIPMPSIEDRDSDIVFVYLLPAVGKKIIVIIERSGEVADTFVSM